MYNVGEIDNSVQVSPENLRDLSEDEVLKLLELLADKTADATEEVYICTYKYIYIYEYMRFFYIHMSIYL
jgi:hypothetical protein